MLAKMPILIYNITMNLGVVVIIIMAILLVFHLVFFKLTQDDTNQFIIYGIFVCYALCILLEKGATGIVFINNLPDIVSQALISAALLLGVWYVSNLMDDRIFRRITIFLICADCVIFMMTVLFSLLHILPGFYFPAMFVLCVVSLSVYIGFLIRCWSDLPGWYRILLCAMLFMVVCFTMLLLFDVLHIPYAYYWAIGFIVYVAVYEFFSVWKVIEEIALYRRMALSASEPTDKPHESENADVPQIKWTNAEIKILQIMGRGDTESKVIAVQLDKSTATIDTQIRTMLKKSGLSSRMELARMYGIK